MICLLHGSILAWSEDLPHCLMAIWNWTMKLRNERKSTVSLINDVNEDRTPEILHSLWGTLEIWADTPTYAGASLRMRGGKRTSFGYFTERDVTYMLAKGKAQIGIEDDKGNIKRIDMLTGLGYNFPPFRRHRLIAINDSLVIQTGDAFKGIRVRLEDDFNRPDETEEDFARRRKNARANKQE